MVGLLLVGCGGESVPPSKNVDVNLKGETGACLKELGDKLSAYLNQELSEPQIREIWGCLDGALNDFIAITSPEHPRGYPPDALARFFESFFLKREIPLPVAEALMNLKRILIGGEREFLTTDEISKLKVVLEKAEGWSIRLSPHLDALFLRNPSHLSFSRVESGFRELSQVGSEVGLWLEDQGEVYTQTEVRALLLSIRDWIAPGSRGDVIGTVLESLPLLFELKALLIGGTERRIQATEWPLFLRKATSVLSLMQTVNLKMKVGSYTSLIHDASFGGILFDVKSLFEGVSAPYSDFHKLLEKASKLSWWPGGIPISGLSNALRFFFQRFLEIDEGRSYLTIDYRVVEKLEQLRASYRGYVSGSDAKFTGLLGSIGPVYTNGRGMIHFARLGNEPSSSVRRYQLAFLYTLVHQLYDAYEIDRADRPGFQRAFAEVLDVIKDLGFMTSVDPDYAGRLFRETNVFTIVSDGDAYLSEGELTVYAWMVLSALNQQEWTLAQIDRSCRRVESCVYKQWTKNFSNHLDNFPLVSSYLQGLNSDQRRYFFEVAKGASGSESLIMNIMILSYLEFYMIRFDRGDSILNTAEVIDSFDVFGPTLEELLGSVGVSPEDTLAFFTYLFKYGSTPLDMDAYGGWLRYLNWKLFPDRWDIAADRTRLLQILSELGKL